MAILPKIISRWFAPNKRGFGMSLCTPGANFAALILGVIAPLVINGLGWNMALRSVRHLLRLITVFVALTFREGPEEKGLVPYGAPKGTQAAPAPKLEEKAVASGKKVPRCAKLREWVSPGTSACSTRCTSWAIWLQRSTMSCR